MDNKAAAAIAAILKKLTELRDEVLVVYNAEVQDSRDHGGWFGDFEGREQYISDHIISSLEEGTLAMKKAEETLGEAIAFIQEREDDEADDRRRRERDQRIEDGDESAAEDKYNEYLDLPPLYSQPED